MFRPVYSKSFLLYPSLNNILDYGILSLTGWASNITLDGSESFDPDWEDVYDGEYHWYCHLTNETLPPDIDVNQDLPETGTYRVVQNEYMVLNRYIQGGSK